jgi:hypothetical protein
MGPQFAEHESSARENAARQANVQRLVTKAEYEFGQMRRELAGLIAVANEPVAVERVSQRAPATPPAETEFVVDASKPARAA